MCPPRYVGADAMLKRAIVKDIEALELRNQAIAESNDAAFQEHKIVLEEALELFQQAYKMFPEDNRPQPPP